nr:hypothetical protein [Tanacetum cinerariifolium]
MYEFRECSSCEALYTKSCACSKGGFVDKFVRDPNKTPDSSQRPPYDCPRCGSPVDSLYCRHCALLRKKLMKVWSTICDQQEFFQDFLNTSKSSNDESNIVNVRQDPIVFNQDPSESPSQSPPQIDHHCCYECGDSLDGFFCQQCTCKSCGKGAYYDYNCPPKVPIISNPKPCHDQNVDEFPQTLTSFHPTCYSGDENSFAYDLTPNFVNDSPNVFNLPSQPPMYSYEFYGNDAHFSHNLSSKNVSLMCSFVILQLSLNLLFDADDDFSSNDNESFSDEDIPKEIYSNPLFEEKIISIKIDPHHINAESDLIESLLNQDSSIISSSKNDSLLDEFASELILLKLISSGIDEADCDPEEEIRLIEKLLYDNSSPRPSKGISSTNSDAVIESFSPSHIPFEDSDPFMEKIDLFLTSDGSIP